MVFNLKKEWKNVLGKDTEIPVELFYKDIANKYSFPYRSYHNLEGHISDCLIKLNKFKNLVTDYNVLFFSLFIQDAVYDPRRRDNEERSVDFGNYLIARMGLPSNYLKSEKLIMATKNHLFDNKDEALMISIDLSILGETPKKYENYSLAIRQEYSYLDNKTYVEGRKKFLELMLSRKNIFPLKEFKKKFESTARYNLEKEFIDLSID